MGPVAPLDLPLIDKAQIRFVDEGRGLQDMASPFAAHETGRQAVQVFVDDRHEPVERITTTVAPRNKPLRDGVRVEIGGGHGCPCSVPWPAHYRTAELARSAIRQGAEVIGTSFRA